MFFTVFGLFSVNLISTFLELQAGHKKPVLLLADPSVVNRRFRVK